MRFGWERAGETRVAAQTILCAATIATGSSRRHTRRMNRQQAGLRLIVLAWTSALMLGGARADEIRLKDGKKLYGVIVAYEDNMFKVKTDFGFVLVEKDKIAAIIPTAPAGAAATPKVEVGFDQF